MNYRPLIKDVIKFDNYVVDIEVPLNRNKIAIKAPENSYIKIIVDGYTELTGHFIDLLKLQEDEIGEKNYLYYSIPDALGNITKRKPQYMHLVIEELHKDQIVVVYAE